MRHAHYAMAEGEALALLARAPTMEVAAVQPDGRPLLRILHGVLVDGALAFHASPKGEKADMAGWPAVASAHEVVAEIPSWFVDPERACPATTYYRSVQVEGRFSRVDDPARKARVLDALMAKLQPEGRHVRITHEEPLYRAAVAGLAVLELPIERLSGKAKLGQNRSAADRARILARLWERGGPKDVAAIAALLDANPDTPRPAFLEAPEGAELCLAPTARDLEQAVALLEPQYWNRRATPDQIRGAQRGATAWVVARAGGELVGTARAISDGARRAWIYDVAVAPAWRGRGLGAAILRLLLDHPALREVAFVHLATLDAQRFYRRYGFVEGPGVAQTPGSTPMVLARGAP